MAKEVKHVDAKQPTVAEAKSRKSNVEVYNGSTYSVLDMVVLRFEVEKRAGLLKYAIDKDPNYTKAYLERFNNLEIKEINKLSKEAGHEDIFSTSSDLLNIMKKEATALKVYNKELDDAVRRIELRRKAGA